MTDKLQNFVFQQILLKYPKKSALCFNDIPTKSNAKKFTLCVSTTVFSVPAVKKLQPLQALKKECMLLRNAIDINQRKRTCLVKSYSKS